jgi:lipase ATG15
LFTQLRHVLRAGRWAAVLYFVFVAGEIAATAAVCFTPHFGIDWSKRERNMVYVSCVVLALQSLWVSKEAIVLARRPGGLTETSIAQWWSTRLPPCQRLGCWAILATGVAFSFESGATYGATCVAEGLVYLNFLHVYAAAASRATLFCVRLVESAATVARDPTARYAAVAFAAPLLGVTVANFAMIRNPVVSSLQIVPLLLLVDALAQHTHEHRTEVEAARQRADEFARSPRGSPHASPVNRVFLPAQASFGLFTDVWRIGLQAMFLAQTRAFVFEVHYAVRNTFRAVLRAMLFLFMTIVLAVGVWTSLQFAPGLAGKSKQTCEDLGDGRIRVTGGTMKVELYGLDSHVDPDTLVYEPSQHLYDRLRYDGICQRRWGKGVLHAADLAYFSAAAYLEQGPSAGDDFDVMFNFYRKYRHEGGAWDIVQRGDVPQSGVASATDDEADDLWGRHVDESVSAFFHHFRSDESGVNVIAVRGTDASFARDFLQNILIFSEVFLFEMSSMLVPGAGLLPESFVRDLIRIGSMMDVALFDCDTRRRRHHYSHAVEDYISAWRETDGGVHRNEAVVITGHSLGGVIAQIVGARMRIPAVAFSSPGIVLMDRKFGIDPDAIDAYITNVVVSNDFIPSIGKLGGSVNHIQCEHRRVGVCHSMELQTIRLWSMCPAYRSVIAVNGSYTIHPQPHETMLATIGDSLGSFGFPGW